jgi:hypothetical protein
MSQAEHPDRLKPGRDVTVDDVRQLMGASTPLDRLAFAGEVRGHPAEPGLEPLKSVSEPLIRD